MTAFAATLISIGDGKQYRVVLGYRPDYVRKVITVVEGGKMLNPESGSADMEIPAGDYESIPDECEWVSPHKEDANE